MPNNSGQRFDEGSKRPSSPSPKPYVAYGFVAFMFTLFAMGEAYDSESTLFRTLVCAGMSVVFGVIAILKWLNQPNEDLDFEGVDSVNRGLSRFFMRFWLVIALIGTVALVGNIIKMDWVMVGFCTLMTGFSGYYAYTNWQNSRDRQANTSRES